MSDSKKALQNDNVWIARGACLVGKVKIGRDSSVWYNAVVRGDEAELVIGSETNIQDNVVVHADHGDNCRIGNGVTIGHSAIIHGCTIGDHSLIGMGSIVLNGAVIHDHCIIGAGSLVTKGTVIPEGMMAYGRPAKPVRPLTEEERASVIKSSKDYVRLKNVHKNLHNPFRLI